MIVVTGGAGFIGANIVKALNDRGETDILLVDDLTATEKIVNVADLTVSDYMDKAEFRDRFGRGALPDSISMVFHEGACSDTMATDGRYVMDNNYAYTRDLYEFCQARGVRLVYASSASVYGGNTTFAESAENERPLNAYAYSKYQFDNYLRARRHEGGTQSVGLRYFNVYGPREQHKHRMASVAWHFFNQYREHGKVRLFAGSGGYRDGEQRRDFVFVDDVVAVNLFFLDNPDKSGIFNVGTGRSSSFNDVATAVVNTLRERRGGVPGSTAELVESGEIEYIPMPTALDGKYQSFTEADIGALRDAGFEAPFHTVESGVGAYLRSLPGAADAPRPERRET